MKKTPSKYCLGHEPRASAEDAKALSCVAHHHVSKNPKAFRISRTFKNIMTRFSFLWILNAYSKLYSKLRAIRGPTVVLDDTAVEEPRPGGQSVSKCTREPYRSKAHPQRIPVNSVSKQ